MSKEAAQAEYIQLAKSLYGSSDSTSKSTIMKESAGVFNVRVSTCENNEEALSEDQKTIFDWGREGNIDKIRFILDSNKSLDLSALDENVSLLFLNVEMNCLVSRIK
jgi:hypothetical protein